MVGVAMASVLVFPAAEDQIDRAYVCAQAIDD